MSLIEINKVLKLNENFDIAKKNKRYFKTGKGDYAEKDIFIGIKKPILRLIAKQNFKLKFNDIDKLLYSDIHEKRLLAAFILIESYNKNYLSKLEIFNYYISNTKQFNNWDIVDCSASFIVGDYLFNKDKGILYKFATSKNLWEKRISIVSTHFFIKQNSFIETINISKILLDDKSDLIHKATGWMLREVGKRSINTLIKFLDDNAHVMPRTMLRYSIEHFDQNTRKYYMNLKKSFFNV